MFSFHGWICLRHDTYESNDHKQGACLKALKDYLKALDRPERFWLSGANGEHSLAMFGAHNHRQDYPLETLKWIAKHAPGSYGLLYVLDDEDAPHDNSFRVWRLARGKIEDMEDTLLSPAMPFVEDPYDPARG